jgi:hypothetical protein
MPGVFDMEGHFDVSCTVSELAIVIAILKVGALARSSAEEQFQS